MDLSNCTLVELRQLAKEQGVKNVTKFKKDELIELLDNKGTTSTTQEVHSNSRFQIDEEAKNDSDLTYKLTNEDDFIAQGVLEILPDGYGFLRGENYLSSPKEIGRASCRERV